MALLSKTAYPTCNQTIQPGLLAAFDLESVLVPEIWQAVATLCDVKGLAVTTRDIQDYDLLMQQRMDLCRRHRLTLEKLRVMVAKLSPFPGANQLLAWAQARFQVVILSDTFYELAQPLLGRLGGPLALCHHLEVDSKGFLCGYRLWSSDSKRTAVRTFRQMGYKIMAIGDSYNDLDMLAEADQGLLFSARDELALRFPQYPSLTRYDQLRFYLTQISKRRSSRPETA